MPWLATKASAIHLLFTDSFLLFDYFKTLISCLRDSVLGLLVLHLHLDNLSDEVLCLHQLRPDSRQRSLCAALRAARSRPDLLLKDSDVPLLLFSCLSQLLVLIDDGDSSSRSRPSLHFGELVSDARVIGELCRLFLQDWLVARYVVTGQAADDCVRVSFLGCLLCGWVGLNHFVLLISTILFIN